PDALQAPTSVFPNYNLHVSDTSREAGWETEFNQFESHHCTGAVAATYGTACSLPDFEYVYFGEDHTTIVDEPGYPTIQAQVADNPFVPLPGARPAADPRHGIYSFTKPDATDPRITGAATWRQVKGSAPPRVSVP